MSWSSGTNTIQEVDTNKSMTLQMIKLKKQGGGTEYFVRKNDVKLGTKSVTKNGTYKAAADDKYGFSKFKVNVKGGNGSANSSGKPTYTPPSGSTPASGVEPGGAGSAVVGTDPETGNDVVVGVDSTGTLVTTPIPTSIVLVTNPTKMDYNDGESIDLSGAVVVAKNADGTTWTDADHPNGHVSCTCDPAAADASQVSEASASSEACPEIGSVPFVEVGIGEYTSHDETYKFAITSKTSSVYAVNRKMDPYYAEGPLLCSKSNFNATLTRLSDGRDVSYTYQHSSFNGESYYLNSINVFPKATVYYDGIPTIDSNLNIQRVAYVILFGNKSGGGQTITLNWARPGDGKVLSTTMEITVHSASSEYEDDEGGGAGHSF